MSFLSGYAAPAAAPAEILCAAGRFLIFKLELTQNGASWGKKKIAAHVQKCLENFVMLDL